MARYNPGDIINIRPRKYGFVVNYNRDDRINLLLLSVKLVTRKKFSEYICYCLNLEGGNKFYLTLDSRDNDINKVGDNNVAI